MHSLYEINNKLIDLLPKEIETLGITGGEPTLLGSKLISLLLKIREALPDTWVHLLTNGLYYCDIENVKRLSEISLKNIALGIPINSFDYRQHNYIVKKESYFKLIKALYNLAYYDLKIELRIIVTKQNYSDLLYLAEFIQKNLPFVFRIVFMGLEPIGFAILNDELLWIDPLKYSIQLQEAVVFLAANNFNVSIYNIPLCQLPSELWEYSADSITDWKKRFFKVCELCRVKENCSGVFLSSINKYNKIIVPIV